MTRHLTFARLLCAMLMVASAIGVASASPAQANNCSGNYRVQNTSNLVVHRRKISACGQLDVRATLVCGNWPQWTRSSGWISHPQTVELSCPYASGFKRLDIKMRW